MNKLASGPTVRILESIAPIPADQWNGLAGDSPFLRHEFFSALHDSGCATGYTGWLPQFITLWEEGGLAGAMPLYLKSHSYGEYVFDWAWAEGYHRHYGESYYPKLIGAIPFTPVSGPRALAETAGRRAQLIGAALELAKSLNVSSLHCLFPDAEQIAEFESHNMLRRGGVQFHWHNPGYRDFSDFLAAMSHDKRKKIKQERRRIREAGITFERLSGGAVTEAQWAFFDACYRNTYREHQSAPYLGIEFFRRLGAALPENVLLIIAKREGKAIAGALNLHTRHTLYGRYWGAQEHWPGLHFETCYYQAIEFCIEQGLRVFEAGAQGEHKLARGFLPTPTWSAHWLARPDFAQAVADFLAREARGMRQYINELNESNPFRSDTTVRFPQPRSEP